MQRRTGNSKKNISRRDTLLFGASACATVLAGSAKGLPAASDAGLPGESTYTKDSELGAMRPYEAIHGGKGTVRIKRFPFNGNASPANFIIYDIPPGASEGVHTHHLDDRNKEGPFDEYYYIVSGRGHMEIDGQRVPVSAGDHIHTPLDVAHGIENTDAKENLKVFLTFIRRQA
jgi:quercetin dioxygenase-like cupin family protein